MRLSTIHRAIARGTKRSLARSEAGRWDGKSDPAGTRSIRLLAPGPTGWDAVETANENMSETDSERAKKDRKNALARARRAAAKQAA
jgi:hypothetical protein